MVSNDDVRPVTRIEVLSPSNKLPYLAMRHRTLASGIVLVELDYLHEQPSPFKQVLLDYTQAQTNAYPFYIAITNPHTDRMRFYSFVVDEVIPTLQIPLLNGDVVSVDFNAVYQQTFANDLRAHLLLDYAQEPQHMERYNETDQTRIRAVMKRFSEEQKD